MNKTLDIQHIYFIGIGGIGMSALARYFHALGKKVSGYDRAETALTRQLEAEGIDVCYQDELSLAPKKAELIVYTPAIRETHRQLSFYRSHQYTLRKRSEVLAGITADTFNICVAGTHGKTTVSTLIAHLLRHTGYGCNAFLGGISVNYHTNFWADERALCVVEADEYDRSFLQLQPDIAVITAMDPDHLDIYGTEEAMQEAFIAFSRKIKHGGSLLLKKGIQRSAEFTADKVLTYHLSDITADVYAKNISIDEGQYRFDIVMGSELLIGFELRIGGMHNVENTVAAVAAARLLHIETDKIRGAVRDFLGVKRRFEYVVRKTGLVYIDDYAHHPEELSALLGSAKQLFEDYHCTVVFQPHLYSRTRDLANAFATSLDIADDVVLLPVYPAREQPIAGVSSEMLAAGMEKGKATVVDKEKLLTLLAEKLETGEGRRQLLITAGAGDIDRLVDPIRQLLNDSLRHGD